MTETLGWTQAITRGEGVVFRNGATPPEQDWSSGSRTVYSGEQYQNALQRLSDAVFVLFLLSESAGLILSAAARSLTYGLRSASIADSEDQQWDARNRRRLHLIEKDLAGALAEVERQELAELQSSMAAELNAVAPLPFDHLDDFERQLDKRRGV
jgi:hypothetical protein